MKKFLSAFVASIMLFTLASCGGSTPSPSNSTPSSGGNATSGTPEKVYTLRMSTHVATESPAGQTCEWFINRVSELTNGGVEITLYPNSALGDYAAVVGELMIGSIDMAWSSTAQKYDDRLYLGSTPYMFSTWDEIEYAYAEDSWFTQTISDIHNDLGITIYGAMPGGFYGIGGTNLGNLDTLFDPNTSQGVLCRSSSSTVAVKAVGALGFNNTVVPYSDLYSALQTGVCDCWYGGDAGLNYDSFRDVIKYYADFRYLNEYLPLMISQVTLNGLPEDYRAALHQAGWEASAVGLDLARNSFDDYMQKLEDYGIEVIVPTDEQRNAVAEKVRAEVYPEVATLIGEDLMSGLEQFLDTMAKAS